MDKRAPHLQMGSGKWGVLFTWKQIVFLGVGCTGCLLLYSYY